MMQPLVHLEKRVQISGHLEKKMAGRWVRRNSSDSTVVFVHGINSNENTFRSSAAFWPDLVAEEPELSSFDIYAFEYRSKITAPGYTLGDAVDYFKSVLHLDKIDEGRQTIFVCHSMGGNLVRRFLVMQSLDLAKRQTRCGLFMLACPSTGSHYANLFRMIRRNYHMQLESLVASQKNVWLNDLDKDFKNLLHHAPFPIFGKELAEDVPIVGRLLMPRTQVVPALSATRYFGEPVKVPGADHFTISAPTSAADLQHRLLKQFILENFDTGVGGPPSPPPEVVASDFLDRVDASDLRGAWDQMDALAQKTLVSSYDEFASLFASRLALGEVIDRKLVGGQQLSDPPGWPKGTYKLLYYKGHYSDGSTRGEQLALRRAWSGDWKPFSYMMSLASIEPVSGDTRH